MGGPGWIHFGCFGVEGYMCLGLFCIPQTPRRYSKVLPPLTIYHSRPYQISWGYANPIKWKCWGTTFILHPCRLTWTTRAGSCRVTLNLATRWTAVEVLRKSKRSPRFSTTASTCGRKKNGIHGWSCKKVGRWFFLFNWVMFRFQPFNFLAGLPWKIHILNLKNWWVWIDLV